MVGYIKDMKDRGQDQDRINEITIALTPLWNKISKNCKEFIRHKYFENITSKKNLKSLEIL